MPEGVLYDFYTSASANAGLSRTVPWNEVFSSSAKLQKRFDYIEHMCYCIFIRTYVLSKMLFEHYFRMI